jgi:hypothetical protein
MHSPGRMLRRLSTRSITAAWYCARGANGWEAGRGDPASNNEQTAEAAADQR